jgi:hypothetical protein
MTILSGWLISLITFPGVIFHEIAHRLACFISRVPVYKTCYFRIGIPAGYIIHGPVKGYSNALLLALAPFLVNTLVAILLYIVAISTRAPGNMWWLIYIWLGVSAAYHSLPSDQDAGTLWDYSRKAWMRNFLVILGLPLIVIIRIANKLRFLWFDMIYALSLLFLVWLWLEPDLFS